MKTFSIHTMRNILAVVIALGLGYVAYTVNPSSVEIKKVQAGTGQNVSGWVWSAGAGSGASDPGAGPYTAGSSTGVGWISLNDTNETAPYSGAAYGVNVDTTSKATGGNGVFSGKAWSENVGWINFDSADVAGCPSGTCTAQVDWASGIVTGWAHAYNGSTTSGWDGWIKLGGDGLSWNGSACTGVSDNANTNRCNYGVKIAADGKFSGYAWGSDVIGWIDFAPASAGANSANVAVTPGVCTLANTNGFTWGPCDATASCVSGGGATQYNLTGVQSGICNDGSTGTVVQSCTAASTTCTAGGGVWIKGDGICSAAAGENAINSPQDCKVKTSWWQF